MSLAEKRLRCLERRMEFLKNRTDNGRNKNLSYDCEEMHALAWAIEIIQSLSATKRLVDTGFTPAPRPER